jgi:hypothetical protein
MERKTVENCSNHKDIFLTNLDPKGILRYNCSELIICKSCLKLYGNLILKNDNNKSPETIWHSMNCKCKNDKKETVDPEKTASDAKTSVEFCQCCSMELINFGSKYSSFFCEDCMNLATFYNKISGKNLIPLGKHSLLNGILLVSPYTREEARQFNIQTKAFFKRITLIIEWQKLALFENLHDMGFDFKEDIPLSVYDKRIVGLKKDKYSRFSNMVEFLNSHKIN